MAEKLVWIGKVINIEPISGAERIESLKVVCGHGGLWHGTAFKGQFKVGDLCEVYLQDSLLPDVPRFEFMRKNHHIIRMRKFLGVPSECLIMPLECDGFVGEDITVKREVDRYQKALPASLIGDIAGTFCPFIPRTDEPNFQTVPGMVAYLRDKPYYTTIKADGSSGTAFWHDGAMHGCSRNYELKDTPKSAVWQIIRKYELERVLKDYRLALQFEMVGPGIQKNPLGLPDLQMRLFNIYDFQEHKYLDYLPMAAFVSTYNLPMAELVECSEAFDIEDLRAYAEREYAPGKPAEGVVVRPMQEASIKGQRVSFKIINLNYKGQ